MRSSLPKAGHDALLADLRDANLLGADLRVAVMRGADMTCCIIR